MIEAKIDMKEPLLGAAKRCWRLCDNPRTRNQVQYSWDVLLPGLQVLNVKTI